MTDQDVNKNIEVDNNMVEFKKSYRKNMNHKSLQIHFVPNNWEDPSPAIDKDEATFESIYNSG